jgi:hypothetical protein
MTAHLNLFLIFNCKLVSFDQQLPTTWCPSFSGFLTLTSPSVLRINASSSEPPSPLEVDLRRGRIVPQSSVLAPSWAHLCASLSSSITRQKLQQYPLQDLLWGLNEVTHGMLLYKSGHITLRAPVLFLRTLIIICNYIFVLFVFPPKLKLDKPNVSRDCGCIPSAWI